MRSTAFIIGISALLLAGCTNEKHRFFQKTIILDRSNSDRLNADWIARETTTDPDPGNPLDYLELPMDIAVGLHDSIYVADKKLDHIVVYTHTGIPIRRFGRRGQGPGEFQNLLSIVFDSKSRLWARDAHTVQVLDLSGCTISSYRTPLMDYNGMSTMLPGNHYWTGSPDLAQIIVLYQKDKEPILHVDDDYLDISSSHDFEKLTPREYIGYAASLISGKTAVLFPVVSRRKHMVWLHIYDQDGVLEAEYDIDPAFEIDWVKPPSEMDENTIQMNFSGMCADPEGGFYVVATGHCLICHFDEIAGTFDRIYEVWMISDDDTEERVDVIYGIEIDSKGRFILSGFDSSALGFLMRVAE